MVIQYYKVRFLLLCFMGTAGLYAKELTRFVDFEHPQVIYYNPNYYAFLNLTARRHGRRDPIHYVSAHSECLVECGNEILVDFYIYEFLSNEYRRGFIELHYKLCDWFKLDNVVVPHVMKFLKIKNCPFPKGEYHFVDMSLPPNIPIFRTLPFSKGRLFFNVSNWKTEERVLETQIDINIKEKMESRE